MILSMTRKITRFGAKRAEYFTFQLTISCPCPEPLLVSLLSACFNLKKLVVGMTMMEMTMVEMTMMEVTMMEVIKMERTMMERTIMEMTMIM